MKHTPVPEVEPMLPNTMVCKATTDARDVEGIDELSPRGATYVGRGLSSAREPSSPHTFRVWGCRFNTSNAHCAHLGKLVGCTLLVECSASQWQCLILGLGFGF